MRRFNSFAALIFVLILAAGGLLAYFSYSGPADAGRITGIIFLTFLVALIISAAIKVAQNELISMMFTLHPSCLKPSAREDPILVSLTKVSNSSFNGLGGAFSITR